MSALASRDTLQHDWWPLAVSNRGPSLSESDALPTELSGIQMVRVRGFEPPTSAFQVRSSGLSELHPVELAFPTGIEPACLPVRSRALVQLSYGKNWCDVWDSNPCCCAENADAWLLAERRMTGSGRRIRTCRILINSQAHPPRTVDRNELVDRLGVEPSASCLQGISPPRRSARGARTWFRATLSCSSGRRYHQISFPSVRPARNRTRVIGLALRGPANRQRRHGGWPENRTRHAHRRRF